MNFGSPYQIIGNRNFWLFRQARGDTPPQGFAVIDICHEKDGGAKPQYWALWRYPNDVTRHHVIDFSKVFDGREWNLQEAITRCCDKAGIPENHEVIGLDWKGCAVCN